jgi:hypothetical protein
MENLEIKMLRQELTALREQFADLRAAQHNDRDQAIKAIKELYTEMYQYVADIHDYLWPVVHKIFPEFAESKKQIDAFLSRRTAVKKDR